MKHLFMTILLLLAGMVFPGRIGYEPGRTENDSVKIRVRVLDRGIPVTDLKKEDFEIRVNSKPKTITGFETIRKRITSLPENENQSRSFIFIFDLFSECQQVEKAVESIFNPILPDRDQLIIFINHQIIGFDPPFDQNRVQNYIMDVISRESEKRKKDSAAVILKINESIDYLRENTEVTAGDDQATRSGGKIHRHYYMKYFKSYLDQYVEAIRTYNKKYLLPDIREYARLLASIDSRSREIWSFHFFQMADLPGLSKKNRALIKKMRNDLSDRDWTEAWMDELDYSNKINQLLADIDSALNVIGDFETEPLINLLNGRDITFFSFFFPRNDRTEKEIPDSSSIRNTLKEKWKEIALASGGYFSEQISFQSIITDWFKREKFYYVLSAGIKAADIGKISIALPGHSYRIITDLPNLSILVDKNRQSTVSANKQLGIRNLIYKNRELSFSISNFSRRRIENRANGSVNVRIEIKDAQNRTIYQKEKNLVSEENSINISIDFTKLPGSPQEGTIEVTDLHSGKTAVNFFPFK